MEKNGECRSRLMACKLLLAVSSFQYSVLAQEPSGTELWNRHVAAALEAQSRGDIARAEAEFEEATVVARRHGTASAPYAHVLDVKGAFFDQIGRFAEAESCLRGSLAVWRGLLDSEEPTLARVVNRLAALYLETGQLRKAGQLDLKNWIDLVEAKDPANPDLIQLLENLAALQSLRGHFSESERLYLKALDLTAGGRRPDIFEHAVVLNNLGLACLRSGHSAKAIEHLSASLRIWVQTRGSEDRNTELTSQSLAVAYQQAGRLDEVEPLLRQALQVAEKSFGPNSLRTASILDAYARFLRKRERKTEARRLEEQVRQIMANAGKSHSQVIDVSELRLRGDR
jgi:tetratricopeptide (TPR) repeat protein